MKALGMPKDRAKDGECSGSSVEELIPYKDTVGGSIPSWSTSYGPVV